MQLQCCILHFNETRRIQKSLLRIGEFHKITELLIQEMHNSNEIFKILCNI